MIPSFLDADGHIDFRLLYNIYYAPFCLFAKRFIDDGDVRQDIVQDVFVSIWSKFEGMEVKTDAILAYIKMCVRNSCLNYIEHERHVESYAKSAMDRGLVYATSPDSLYTLDEMYARLNSIVASMSEEQRVVFEQTVLDDCKQAEVAVRLGVSVKTVGRCRQRIMQMLRRDLKDYMSVVLMCCMLGD